MGKCIFGMHFPVESCCCRKILEHWSVFFFSLGTLLSSTNETNRHIITEILLKDALNTITITMTNFILSWLNQTKMLSELNFIGTKFYVRIQVLVLCRLNKQKFPTLGFYSKLGLFTIQVYSVFGLDMFHRIIHWCTFTSTKY